MTKSKNKELVDLSANPQNIQVGDWVVTQKNNLVGEVDSIVNNNGDILQFWVKWFKHNNTPTPELASNLIKVPKQQNGYLGKQTSLGLVSSMVLVGKKVKYEIETELGTPRLLTRVQVENKLIRDLPDQLLNTPKVEVQIEVLKDLTYDEQNDRLHLERKVERAFYEAGKALQELRERKLYRSTHKTFEEYCKDRFGFGRSRSCRLIDAVAVCDNLSYSQMLPNGQQKDELETLPNGSQILPSSERQVRPLIKLEPDQQREAWTKAVELAGGKVPSGRIVKDIVQRIKEKVKPPNPFHVGDICRVIARNEPELKSKTGQWCIVSQIHEFSCTVKTYQGETTINTDNLLLIDYSTDDCEQLSRLCDRLHNLHSQGLEEIASHIVDRIAKFDRAYLTDLEEKLLTVLESNLINVMTK